MCRPMRNEISPDHLIPRMCDESRVQGGPCQPHVLWGADMAGEDNHRPGSFGAR